MPEIKINGGTLRFIVYPGGLLAVLLIRILIVLVIRRCVNATEATMETARLVKEDRREVNACGVQS